MIGARGKNVRGSVKIVNQVTDLQCFICIKRIYFMSKCISGSSLASFGWYLSSIE